VLATLAQDMNAGGVQIQVADDQLCGFIGTRAGVV
jgi:hypothetical protein